MADTVDIEVQSKVKKLKIVCDCSEYLESKMLVERNRIDNGEDGCRSCAADKEDHNGDENQDQPSLFRTLKRLSAGR